MGATVLGIWPEVHGFPFTKTRVYEAHESVTDAEGRFEILRLKVPFWKLGVQPGGVGICIPGYVLDRVVVTPPDGQRYITPTVIQMRRLKTRRERLKNLHRRPDVPFDKMPNCLRAVNEERRRLGLQQYEGKEKLV